MNRLEFLLLKLYITDVPLTEKELRELDELYLDDPDRYNEVEKGMVPVDSRVLNDFFFGDFENN